MPKVIHRRGSVRVPSRVILRRRRIWIEGELKEVRAQRPHDFRNTFFRNPQIDGCDLCDKKFRHAIHRF